MNKLLAVVLITVTLLVLVPTVFAAPKGAGEECVSGDTCPSGYSCQKVNEQGDRLCEKTTVNSVFGEINPPEAIKKLAGGDVTGAAGISQFFTNLVGLFYTVAAIALIFMLLWGAFEWMTSGGDKEKLAGAQRRIINAIIGLVLFAIAFPILQLLGVFTGLDFIHFCPPGLRWEGDACIGRSIPGI